MESRAATHRARGRRVFLWSLGIAVALHVAAFLFWPEMPVEPLTAGSVVEGEPEDVDDDVLRVQVDARFGPPRILRSDGSWAEEPPDRTLQAGRAVSLPAYCVGRTQTVEGDVRLRLNTEGRVHLVRVEQGSGSSCGDEALRSVAGDLWYRWLPDKRFPAPVDLIQPVSLRLGP